MAENNHTTAKSERGQIPGWVQMLFGGVLAIGLLYIIFLHGFLGYSNEATYRKSAGIDRITATVVEIPDRTPESIQAGATAYRQACVACHGVNKEGGVGPALNDSDWLHEPVTETNMFNLVNAGIAAGESVTGIVMPARGGASISETQVWEIIYYLSDENSSIEQDAGEAEM